MGERTKIDARGAFCRRGIVGLPDASASRLAALESRLPPSSNR